jgi:hypothetical protein
MNEVKSFSFFDSYYEAVDSLDEENKKLMLVAIVDYVFKDIEPELNGVNKALWNFMKMSLDTSKIRSKVSQKETNEEQNKIKKKTKQNQNENKIKSKANQKGKQNENILCNHNHNHILNHNHNNNLNSKDIEKEFEELWKLYPNKKGKDQALKKYLKYRQDGITYEEVKNGIDSYNNYIEKNDIKQQYIKHGSTWFNNKCWEDDYKVNDGTPDWFYKDIKSDPMTEEEKKEMEKLLESI